MAQRTSGETKETVKKAIRKYPRKGVAKAEKSEQPLLARNLVQGPQKPIPQVLLTDPCRSAVETSPGRLAGASRRTPWAARRGTRDGHSGLPSTFVPKKGSFKATELAHSSGASTLLRCFHTPPVLPHSSGAVAKGHGQCYLPDRKSRPHRWNHDHSSSIGTGGG